MEKIVEWRPFPFPDKIRGFDGGAIGDVILLSGKMLEPGGHRTMLRDRVA